VIATDPVWGLSPRDRVGEPPSRTDVLVVGGGITGVGLLWHLRDAGAVLVERDRLAAGASGRNAGFIVQGVGYNSYADAIRSLGRRRARETWGFSVETHDLLEEALAGRSPHHRRRGHVAIPVDDEERRGLEESAQVLAEDGIEVVWDGQRLTFPRDGEHNPMETVCALASDAPPGAIREGVEVTAIESSGDDVRVELDGRECRAGVVILATNGYTAHLLPDVEIVPQRAQMAATAPEAAPIAPCPTGRNHGYQYWNQLWDGRVAAGGYRDTAFEEEQTDQATPSPGVQAHLDAHLKEWGVEAPVTHRWAGIMGFTADGLPMVREVRPNVWVCGGYNGSGMSFAFHCARRLAEHLTGRRSAPIVPWQEP
jgi:gamma-glutamylputrescine oxidase